MSFNSADFNFYAFNPLNESTAIWKYTTSDNLTDIVTSYFASTNEQVRTGDQIAVTAGDGSDIFNVGAVTYGSSVNAGPVGYF